MTLGYTDGALTSISDYEGNASTIEYWADGRTKRVDHPLVYDYVVDEEVDTSREYAYVTGETTYNTEVTDERGGVSQYAFDGAGRLVEIIDPLGRTVAQHTWTSQFRLQTTENVLGGMTTIQYDGKGDPVWTVTPRGTIYTQFDSLHRLTQVTDAIGQVTEYFYENPDNPTKVTRIKGPGTYNEAKFYWGCDDPDHSVGRPSYKPKVFYESFSYQAQSWDRPRRVVAKVEWHWDELFPRVGFIVTNMTGWSRKVVHFYNQRGTAEQWIREGKHAVRWTRLSCRNFRDNQVRLQLFALAYNLGNFLRRLALPRSVKHWSLTTLREKLIKIGAKVVTHSRYVIFQMANVAVPRELFAAILDRIQRFGVPPPLVQSS
jgi:YD repeat-containing protein